MSDPALNVIRLQPVDAERYGVLRREMLADSPWAFASSVEDDRGCNAGLMRESLENHETAVLALEESANGRLLAAAGVLRDVKLKRRHIAMIWGVYVTPSARRTGAGRAVVRAAVDAARGWPGVTHVHLSVSESVAPPGVSAARRLYESLGFRAWGTEPDAMRVGERMYADTHMVLWL